MAVGLQDFTPGFIQNPTGVPDPATYRSGYDFTTQFFPSLKEGLVKRYSDESLTGFLELLGYEEEFASDIHYWAEEGRMFRSYSDGTIDSTGTTSTITFAGGHNIRPKETIAIYDKEGASDEALVESVSGDSITVAPYSTADLSAPTWDADNSAGNLFVHVIGAEQPKGGSGMSGGLQKDIDILENKPFIMPGVYEINNSDLAHIAWVQDDMGSKYWFLEQVENQRAVYMNNLEKKMILGRNIESGSTLDSTNYGSKGLFEQMRERGNNFQGLLDSYADLKNIIKRLDKQSGERYNVLFGSRDQKFKWDEIFATLNPNVADQYDFGAFPNGKEQALDLGFSGATFGGYEFYSTTWKLLKNPTALGSDNIPEASKVHGVMLPMGETMSTTAGKYEEISSNSTKPIKYITSMYRGMPGYSRKYQEWVLGGGGRVKPGTSADDKMAVHWLSERMLRLAGANKAFIFEGSNS